MVTQLYYKGGAPESSPAYNDLCIPVDLEYVSKEACDKYAKQLYKHISNVIDVGIRMYGQGEPWFGHDESKWSGEEFQYYARYFFQDKGDTAGFNKAWLHHIHNNPHHWQHWIIPIDNTCIPMPKECIDEMAYDLLGSEMTYAGRYDMTKWWKNNEDNIVMHRESKEYLIYVLESVEMGKLLDREKAEKEKTI
jgi:hypothetical protein